MIFCKVSKLIAMLRILCFVLLVALNISAGKALKCYGCVASTTSDCYQGIKPAFYHQECRPNESGLSLSVLPKIQNAAVPIETVCVDVVFTDYEPNNVVERGCGYIFEGVDICSFLNWTTNIASCSYCRSELCNSNPIWP